MSTASVIPYPGRKRHAGEIRREADAARERALHIKRTIDRAAGVVDRLDARMEACDREIERLQARKKLAAKRLERIEDDTLRRMRRAQLDKLIWRGTHTHDALESAAVNRHRRITDSERPPPREDC